MPEPLTARDEADMQALFTGFLLASVHEATTKALAPPVTTDEVSPGLLRFTLASGLKVTIQIAVHQ